MDINEALIKPTDAQIHTSVPSISLPKINSGLVHTPTFYSSKRRFRYEKPNQHVKDLGDLVLGNPFLGTEQLQQTLIDNDSLFTYVPILNRVAGLFWMSKERFADPLLQGKPGTALVKSFETIGGTLDILANPVKSLMPWAGGGTGEDFLKSMGWLEGEYRETYQWDTGNFVIDFLGEMVSDPINWVTWGTSAAAKRSVAGLADDARSLLQSTQVTYMADNGTEVVSNALETFNKLKPREQRKILNFLSEALATDTDEHIIKKLEQMFIARTMKDPLGREVKVMSKFSKRLRMNEKAFLELQNNILKASKSGLYDAYKTIVKVKDTAKAFDKGLAKLARNLTPIGWSGLAIRHIIKPTFASVNAFILSRMKQFESTDVMDRGRVAFKQLTREAIAKAEAVSDYTKTGMKDVLKSFNLSWEDVNNMYLDTFGHTVGHNRDFVTMREYFKKQLLSRMQGAYVAGFGERVWSIGFPYAGMHQRNLEAAIRALEDSGVKLSQVKIVIPENVFNDLFWEVWSTNKEIINAQNKFISNNLNIFAKELKEAFTSKSKRADILNRPYTTYNSPYVTDQFKLEQFHKSLEYAVKRTNSDIRTLKNLAYKILSAEGWNGSYMDKQQFWLLLKENNPSTTLTTLGTIIDAGLTKDATIALSQDFKEYKEVYDNMVQRINRFAKRGFIRNGVLNTKDVHNPGVILDTLYTYYNGITQEARYSQYPIRDIIGFIDGGFLKIDNQVYDLDHITDYFKAAKKAGIDTSHQKAILEYFGITTNSASLIKRLYNKRDAMALNQLQLILEQGKTGRRAYNAQVDSFRNIWMKENKHYNNTADVINGVKKSMRELLEGKETTAQYSELIKQSAKNLESANEYLHNIQFTNIPAYEMPIFEKLLEKIGMPANEFDELWRHLFSQDFTALSPDKYLEIVNEAARLVTIIDSIAEVAHSQGAELPENMLKFFNEMKESIEKYINPLDNTVANMIDLSQSIYIPILSKEARMRLIIDAEFAHMDTRYGQWFEKLKHSTSKERDAFEKLIERLNANGFNDAAKQFSNLLTQIDQHVIVNRLLNMEVPEMYVHYDSDTINFIRSALYNKINSKEYAGASATTLSNLSEKIAKDVADDVMNYIKKHHLDTIIDTQQSIHDNTIQYIKEHALNHGIKLNIVKGDVLGPGVLGQMEPLPGGRRVLHLLDPKYYEITIPGWDPANNPIRPGWFDGNGTLHRLQNIDKYAKTNEEYMLYVYFHELEHLLNKDDKKFGFERDLNKYQKRVHEAIARIAEFTARKDVSSIDNILEAEYENIFRTYLSVITEYSNHLHDIEIRDAVSGLSANDVLDGNMAKLVRQIGNNSNDTLKAIQKLNNEELYNDYYEAITNLLGKDTAMEHRQIVTSWGRLSKDVLARYTPDLKDAEIMQNFKRTFNYIGTTNDKLSGMTGASKDYATIANLMTQSEVQDAIDRAGYEANIFEYSVMNKYVSFNKVFDPVDALKAGIRPYEDMIVTNQAEYLDFYNNFMENYKRAEHLISNYDEDQLLNIKNRLIAQYKHAGSGIAPINAETYFRMMDITNEQDKLKLITWHGMSILNPSKSFSKYSSLETFRDPWMYFALVDNVFRDNTLINVDGIAEIINMDPPNYVLEELYPRFDFSISSYYKSAEQLKRTQIPFNRYIQDNLAARHYTTDTLEYLKARLGETKIKDVSKDLHKIVNASPNTTLSSNAVQYFVKETIQGDRAITFARANPEQLRTLVDESGGFIIYMAEDGEQPFKKLTKEVQEKYGLLLHQQSDNIYFLRRTDNTMHNAKITWYRSLPKELDFLIGQKEEILKYNKAYIDLRGTTIPYYYLTGDTMDNVLYDYILNSEHFSTFFGDESVRDTYLKYDFEDGTSFYKKAYSRPQFTIVGKNGYNKFLEYLRYDLQVETNFTKKNLRFDNAIQNGMFDWITRHNNKTSLLSLFANDETLLDNEIYHKMLDHLDNNQLQDFFRKGNYTAVVVKEVEGKPKVFPFIITSQKDLERARKQGAHFFTEAIYRNLQLTINKENISNELIRMYRQTVVGGFKSIWLTTPGALLRNAIDSLVYKNLNETGGAVSMFEMFRYEYQAGKLLDFVNKVQAEVFARTDGKTFNREILTDVLMKLPKEDRELYYFVDAFISSGASGSLTESMQEFLLQFNKTKDAGYAWERVINNAIFESNFSPTKWAMDINGKIEQTARLGLFLALVDKCDNTIDEALSRVIRTHFDYTVKTGLEDLIEQVFWFSTFPINNLLYYINGGLERNPVMLKAMMDLNELSWNNGEYTYDEIAEKPYLQYHVLQGNIRWRSKDGKKDYILKLGPSLFDFYNVVVNPHGEAVDRLNPFLAVATGREGLAELNPINTHISRFFKLIRGESLLPSVYNKKDVYTRTKKYYTRYNYDRSSWNSGSVRTYPKRFKKPRTVLPLVAYRNRHYWTRKYYVHDTKWNNRFMKPITYEPYYDPTSNKYRGAFNRQRRMYLKLPTITPEMRKFTNQHNKREIT